MIAFPHAKINLGLAVTGQRPDGYHEIETVFYPIGLKDALEVIPSPDGKFAFTSSGLSIPGDTAQNLCVRAWDALSAQYNLPPVHLHLHKMIPMGAGLGGGSSDGAFTLRLLNDLFELDLSPFVLHEQAARLGSDCAYFVREGPQSATGRGEVLQPLSVDLRGYSIAVIVPPVQVSTAMAYSRITSRIPQEPVLNSLKRPVTEWREYLQNAFEEPVFDLFPVIGWIHDRLYRVGAVYASMSGSGSAVFGLFEGIPELDGIFPDCFIWVDQGTVIGAV